MWLYVSEKMHTGFGDECMSLIKMDKSNQEEKEMSIKLNCI